jgi:hypothetical protein
MVTADPRPISRRSSAKRKSRAITPCLAPGALRQPAKADNITATSDFAGRYPQADRPHPRYAAQFARRPICAAAIKA